MLIEGDKDLLNNGEDRSALGGNAFEKVSKKTSTKQLVFYFVATTLFISLIFSLQKSVPNDANFELWVKKRASERKGEESTVIQNGVSIANQIQILATYKYSDYQVIALVEAKANGESMKFIGIANTWILLYSK